MLNSLQAGYALKRPLDGGKITRNGDAFETGQFFARLYEQIFGGVIRHDVDIREHGMNLQRQLAIAATVIQKALTWLKIEQMKRFCKSLRVQPALEWVFTADRVGRVRRHDDIGIVAEQSDSTKKTMYPSDVRFSRRSFVFANIYKLCYNIFVMQPHTKHTQLVLSGITAVFVVVSAFAVRATDQSTQVESPTIATSETSQTQVPDDTSNVILRMQRRLELHGAAPNAAELEKSLDERAKMMEEPVTIVVSDPHRTDVPTATWTIDFSAHPELLTFRHTLLGTSFDVNEELLASYIETDMFKGMTKSRSAIVGETSVDAKNVTRATGTPVAQDGYEYDAEDVADDIIDAIVRGERTVQLSLRYEKGSVQMRVNGELQTLSLLSEGVSDYSNSPAGRVWNVHKAIEERVNNVVITQGSEYSMVEVLDAPITTQKGWKEEMGLFGGGAAMTPGAGICQSSTTVYRAALLAGLPITYRRYHSMFVDHYEPYGVGLDSTVFPGVHDLTFINDTPGDILLQAYIVGDLVYVRMYGVTDGRSVALDGPYFNTTPNRPSTIRALAWDQTAWERSVTYADGRIDTKQIYSTYHKGFAGSVKKKYANAPGMILLSSDTAHLEVAAQIAPAEVE